MSSGSLEGKTAPHPGLPPLLPREPSTEDKLAAYQNGGDETTAPEERGGYGAEKERYSSNGKGEIAGMEFL